MFTSQGGINARRLSTMFWLAALIAATLFLSYVHYTMTNPTPVVLGQSIEFFEDGSCEVVNQYGEREGLSIEECTLLDDPTSTYNPALFKE